MTNEEFVKQREPDARCVQIVRGQWNVVYGDDPDQPGYANIVEPSAATPDAAWKIAREKLEPISGDSPEAQDRNVDTQNDVRNGFICAEWRQNSEGPILDFATMKRRQVVYRCDRPDGHTGDHVDSVLLVNWPQLPAAVHESPSRPEAQDEPRKLSLIPYIKHIQGLVNDGTTQENVLKALEDLLHRAYTKEAVNG